MTSWPKPDGSEMLMDAIDHTYDQVFFDLGLIDDSIISAQILAMADQVVVATGGSPAGPELEEALRMLEDQTGAPVAVGSVQRKGRNRQAPFRYGCLKPTGHGMRRPAASSCSGPSDW
ncbi:MAG: hypothetical protein HPM95_07660 [Alphaproteobacteria bacterium]|nr:hypothetical protein [Alphaproteobacteria bacterium]